MEQLFVKAWQRQALWLWLLLPLSWIYGLVTWIHKKSYQFGLRKIYYPQVPVIVIGNITVGGSGKTPFVIALVEYLQTKSIQVGVISRGYGGNTEKMPIIVTKQSNPTDVGDEPCLIVQSTNVAMAVCPNRGQAIDLLLEKFPNIQLILADDGLQHYQLDRDRDWIVVDKDRGFGNQQLLPTGFLREPLRRLQQPNTTVIYHATEIFDKNTLTMRLVEQTIQPLFFEMSENLQLSTQKVIAMTGIGYPKRFFHSLQKLGFDIVEKAWNDHHIYQLADFYNYQHLPIIMTSKDAVKVKYLLNNILNQPFQYSQEQLTFTKKIAKNIWVLPIIAELSPTVYQEIDEQLQSLSIFSNN